MAGLDDQLKGVTPADSPAVEPEPEPKPEPKEGEGGDDRTLENVRGELLRKMKEQEAKIEGMFTQLSNQMSQQTKSSQSQSLTPDNVDANDLSTYSAAQLENLKRSTDWSKVSDADKDAFEGILSQRRIDEALNSKLAVFTEQQTIDQERQRFGQIAMDRYPDLGDKTSEFAREVNAKIQAMPESLVFSNPRIVLDISNEVAITKDVKPQRRRSVSGKPASTRTAPTDKPDTANLRSDAEHDQIASRLANALPRGKKFDRDRIRKKEQDVQERMMLIRPSKEDDLNE
jgi:hypothetical protein